MQLKEIVKYPVERLLARLEERLIGRATRLSHVPVFMVAPARSGSTLLYQVMTRYFDLCYFSNSMTRFPASPVSFAHLLAPFGACDPPENFSSYRGHVEGGKAPTDASKIWARWFPDDPQYTPNGVLTPQQQREIRATVSCFQEAFRAPFINKTQRNCGRILALTEIFPEAVFVRVHRDPFEMVRSRWQIFKDRADENWLWQSYRPSNSSQIVTESPIEHLCQQVALTEAEIARDRCAIGSRGFFDIDYSGFCRQPRDTLERFAEFYLNYTGRALRNRHEIPQRFHSKHSAEIPLEEAEAIRKYLGRQTNTTAVLEADSCRDTAGAGRDRAPDQN